MSGLILALLLAGPARGDAPEVPVASVALPAPSHALVERALPGGDTLLVVEDRRAPLVAVSVAFPVGTASPWARRHDLAAAWRLQLDDPDGALRARADALAAPLEVRVDTGAVWLQASCLKDDLPEVLRLLGDVLRNDHLDRAALRRAVLADRVQWRAGSRHPEARVERAVRQATFPKGHPARDDRFRAPTRRLSALLATRDAVVRAPGRVVGLAGDVTADEALPLLEGLLPPAEGRPPDAEPVWPAPLPADARAPVHVRLPRLTQAYVALTREGLTVDHPELPGLLVATHVLGGHFYSRLYRALRHDDGQTYAVRAGGPLSFVVTPWAIRTSTRVDNLERLERTLDAALARFRDEGLTAQELADARGWLAGRARMEQQGPGATLGRAMVERLRGVPPGTLDEIRAAALELELHDVNAFIRRWFHPDAFERVRVVPRR